MNNKPSSNFDTFQSIYRLKHDLLHLRILFNPLRDIMWHLERTTNDQNAFLHLKNYRLDLHHHLIRSSVNPIHLSPLPMTTTHDRRRSSVYFNENSYQYLRGLDDHMNLLINSIEIEREHISTLVSFWLTFTDNQTQRILKFLMLITVVFMPCMSLTAMCSMNFDNEPPMHFKYGYFIIVLVLATILSGMVTWYKHKKWI